MRFQNKEAEDYYKDLVKDLGYIHINASGEISLNALKSIRKSIQKTIDEEVIK